jgi:peptide/nickel transport system substrate-binding protein
LALKVYDYNPEKAKKLLEEAGWNWDYTVRILYYNDDETSKNIIAAIVQYLQDVGMKAESTYTSQGTQDLFTTRDYDIGFKGTGRL